MRYAALLISAGWLTSWLAGAGPATSEPELIYPSIKNYGGIVQLSDAAQQPRTGAKVVFDITAEGQPGKVNPGLDRVARFINLNAGGGVQPGQIQIAAVVHGAATATVLHDAAYVRSIKQAGDNPNLELLRRLKQAGVELYVCGQALAHYGFDRREVMDSVDVAVAAMTVSVNKQMDGFAYIPLR